MSKINVLSFEIANLIAAGEVVERPSSVLKELLENAIDSGASEIVAEIKKGGVSLIRVTDNGCGIEAEDLPVALKRHATSKIKDREDLETIMTLGFRGEALAAISSVSEMTIISRTENAEAATMMTAEAGKVIDITEVGASVGTTVVVENLFGNVPARRKFLKKDATEAASVTALVEKVALSHPEISFLLRIDGEQRFKTLGDGNLYNAIYSVFGKDFASKLIKAEGTAHGIKISGYIGRSDNVKKNRNLENFFINGRYVKSLTAMAAIEKAYTSYIAPECFPACVMFIEMNPWNIDVNVHPAKLEVKFSEEKDVFEAIYYTVKNALEEHEYRPELELASSKTSERNPLGAFVAAGEKTSGEQIKIGFSAPSFKKETEVYQKPSYGNVSLDKPLCVSSGAGSSFKHRDFSRGGDTISVRDSLEVLERYKNASAAVEEKTENKAHFQNENNSQEILPDYKIIGEAFDCYVMVESDGALLIIDKHAAHERIIFEELKKTQKSDGRISSQALMLPLTVILGPEELSMLNEYREDISAVGFEFNITDGSADILAIPGTIGISSAEDLFIKMLDELASGKGNPEITDSIRREKALYQIACKAAIKGGRVYDKALIEWLVKKVLLLPDITVCPHGRPIAYRLTKNELDRQFERIK